MSSKEKTLIKQAKQMGQPIPTRIQNKPILNSDLMLYYDAFFELQNDRNASNRIPWTTIVAFVDRYNLSETQEERLIDFIRVLDDTYVDWLNRGGRNGNSV